MVRHDLPQNSTSVASLPLVVFVGLTSLPIINQFVIMAEDAKTFGSCFRIDDRKYTTANSLCLIEMDAATDHPVKNYRDPISCLSGILLPRLGRPLRCRIVLDHRLARPSGTKHLVHAVA
jgi:hypothetical protein